MSSINIKHVAAYRMDDIPLLCNVSNKVGRMALDSSGVYQLQ